MNAVPPVVRGSDVDPTGRYVCPLCKVQRTGDEVDIGWVACPMVHGKMICLGSCLDYQAEARSPEFNRHHDYLLFRELASETRRREQELRLVCLQHQAEIIDDRLASHTDDATRLNALKDEVCRALAEASLANSGSVDRGNWP